MTDVAAVLLLLQRATKEELWRHGYVFWCSDNVWRLCAHQHHPSPAFQRLMRPGQKHSLQGGPYIDVYLMWQQQIDDTNAAAATAAMHDDADAAADNLVIPQQVQQPQHVSKLAVQPSYSSSQTRKHKASWSQLPKLWASRRRRQVEWQLCFSRVPVRLSGRRRAVVVDGLLLQVPDNAEQLLEGEL